MIGLLFVYFLISFVLIGLDQWMKYWIVSTISLGETREFIPHLLSLTYIQNSGAAWSILEGKILFFAIITLVTVGVVLYFLIRGRNGNKLLNIGLSLILAGAIGNFIDRIRLGYVVDMFQTEFMNFPIFNIADAALTIGVLFVFIYSLFEEKWKG